LVDYLIPARNDCRLLLPLRMAMASVGLLKVPRGVAASRGFRKPVQWADGSRLIERDVLGRIKSLAIAPAWTDVWICPFADGHVSTPSERSVWACKMPRISSAIARFII
jgi:DNA topoisomerase IB-like protein